MDEQSWSTQQFELHRGHLEAVAYRMLGSVGSWLPEPIVIVEPGEDPEQQALLADSVGLALLVVLENLTPAERLAYVLHDMFDVPFEDIAPIVGRTAPAGRQLASRARRRVRGLAPEPDPNIARPREVVDAFLAASRAGDFDALLTVLDPDVVFRVDSGGIGPEARSPIHGASAVAVAATRTRGALRAERQACDRQRHGRADRFDGRRAARRRWTHRRRGEGHRDRSDHRPREATRAARVLSGGS